MKILNKQKMALFFLSFISLILFLLINGCSPYGPTLPLASVDELTDDDLKTAVSGLYKIWPADVLVSIETIGKMGKGALPAIPYLTLMLADKRLAKKRNYGFVKPAPIFKESALTLGEMGEEGIYALVDSLKNTFVDNGIDDDFIREAVAIGLKRGKEKGGTSTFRKMRNTEKVIYILNAVSSCLALSENPGRFNKYDPRANLKYYKHFLPLPAREGLKTYIEILGETGDERALPLLSEIVPLTLEFSNHDKLQTISQIQRASALAQYKIHPLPIEKINPIIAEYLFIEFIVQGEITLVNKMLEEGMSPNIQTLTREPVAYLAFKKKYINIFNLLVEKGALLDAHLTKKDTLLIRAAGKGDYDFVRLLIENGADLSLRNNAGQTAIDTALKELLKFWDGRKTKGEAEPYLKIITFLKNSGSTVTNKALLKSVDKKALKILGL